MRTHASLDYRGPKSSSVLLSASTLTWQTYWKLFTLLWNQYLKPLIEITYEIICQNLFKHL